MKKLIFLTLSLALGFFVSCKKNGTGGENMITASPKHHGVLIPNATVYIKYGATELPGKNPSDYDDSKIAIRKSATDAHAHFDGLLKGNYYIYAVGFDSTVNETVSGGIGVKITSKSGEQIVDVPVVE